MPPFELAVSVMGALAFASIVFVWEGSKMKSTLPAMLPLGLIILGCDAIAAISYLFSH